MKKVLFIALALIGFSFSSIASTPADKDGVQTRISVENGIKTVTTQQTFESSVLQSKVESTVSFLESAFNSKAKVCQSEANCYYDFSSSNGETARLLVDKSKNTILLVTKKNI